MSANKTHQEIEVRFLNIDKEKLIQKLHALGAKDHGEDLLKEIIFYNDTLVRKEEGKLVRMRQTPTKTLLAYKHHHKNAVDGATEIEVTIDSWEKGKALLEAIGLPIGREQEKRRHTFTLDNVTIDIDTWPSMPAYVELEGPDEKTLQAFVTQLGFSWNDAIFENAAIVIEKYYHIPIFQLTSFTFSEIR